MATERDPILQVDRGEKFDQIPSDILIAASLNQVDRGRYNRQNPFTGGGGKVALAGLPNQAHSVVEVIQKAITNGTINLGGGVAGVASFEGRTGAVVATAGDYTAAEVTNVPAGNIAATNAQAAINELDTEKQADIQWQDEAVNQGAAGAVNTVNFTGAGVIAAESGGTLTITIPGGGGSFAQDTSTVASVNHTSERLGGTATVLTNPAAGEYTLTVQSGAFLNSATIVGNNTTLNGSNEMILRIDNSANSINRRFILQLYDANNNALVDQQLTATVHTQSVAGNITTLTIPGLNGFGATGYIIEIR